MRVLSLFDGISIAQQALKNIGIIPTAYFSSEIDKYAIQITQKNYPDTVQLGDVKNLKFGKGYFEGDFDLLIGGSPCQDLSIAKKNRKGLDGERSGLFWEYVRILHEVKPKYFILENVNSMPKEAKELITKTIGVEPVMINAALVSAQNRKRLFWIGERDEFGTYKTVAIPQPEDRGILLKDILENGDSDRLKSYCIDANYYKGTSLKHYLEKGVRQVIIDKNGNQKDKSNTIRTSGRSSGIDDKHNWDTIRIGHFGKGSQAEMIYDPNGKSVSLSANGGGGGAKTGLYAVKIVGRRIDKNGTRKDSDKKIPIKQRIEINENPQKTNTLSTVQKDNAILENSVVRKLTPIECERLQSLPDNYTDGISNTQRYKALGNGFNCAVIEHILKHLFLK